ncbi:MAG: hypothetical protein IPL61_20620 [Myxococcales bacterium]|nr:hypothetical protein [Myxococcales bacterium]
MSKQLWFSVAAAVGLAACGGDDSSTTIDAPVGIDATETTDGTPLPTRVDVTGEIAADTTWTADHIYVLKTHIFVRGGTLTIEAGTRIEGDNGSSLVITNGGKIDVRGSATAPVVMTSSQPVGSRNPGDWGGLVLLGTAPINVTGGTAQIEGFPAGTSGTDYGGANAAHDCGKLNYLRVEFGGFELAPNNELNGLTLGACGSATVVDHVQVHKGSDDGIEIFGGSVNVKHLVITQGLDDGLDWDYGWIGKAQFVVIQKSTGSNQGFEADNNGNANDALPRSAPTIYNLSIIGSGVAPGGALQVQKGMHLRRGTAGRISNAIVMSEADFPIDIDGASTVAQVTAGALFVKNSIFFGNGNQATWQDSTDNDGGLVERDLFVTNEASNRESDPLLPMARSQTAPTFKPGDGSPALVPANAATPPNDGFFDATATFVGAVGATDWTTGWTAFPAN